MLIRTDACVYRPVMQESHFPDDMKAKPFPLADRYCTANSAIEESVVNGEAIDRPVGNRDGQLIGGIINLDRHCHLAIRRRMPRRIIQQIAQREAQQNRVGRSDNWLVRCDQIDPLLPIWPRIAARELAH